MSADIKSMPSAYHENLNVAQAFSDCGLRLSPAPPGLVKLNTAIREQLELLAGRPIEKYFVAATNTLR